MRNLENHITGILLAGGRSRRMGKEKGMIRIGKRYLFELPLSILETLCDEILISTCSDDRLPVSYSTICDEVRGIGPMGGLHTCLRKASNDLCIVLSYDMPMVDERLFQHLMKESEGYNIILPAFRNGKPEPLCGIYRKEAATIFHHLIRQQQYAIHGAFSLTSTKIVEIGEEMEFWDPQMFLNINNIKDLDGLSAHPGVERHGY